MKIKPSELRSSVESIRAIANLFKKEMESKEGGMSDDEYEVLNNALDAADAIDTPVIQGVKMPYILEVKSRLYKQGEDVRRRTVICVDERKFFSDSIYDDSGDGWIISAMETVVDHELLPRAILKETKLEDIERWMDLQGVEFIYINATVNDKKYLRKDLPWF